MLGLRDLEPLVVQAVERGAIEESEFEREFFDARLDRAEQAPDDVSRWKEAHLGYLDDVLGALRRFPHEEDEPDTQGLAGPETEEDFGHQPVINPLRHVGRNDPCPCGSGKKAKRCCLAA